MTKTPAAADPLGARLDDWLERRRAGSGPGAQAPVRLLHHFACSGGTILSRCVAALPNVLMLSEIDPLSPIVRNYDKRPFTPTDLIADLNHDPRVLSPDARVEVFLGAFRELYRIAGQNGRYVVVRSHAHSHFCTRVDPVSRPTLTGIVARVAPTREVITVRHPVESFLALNHHGWIHFAPATLDEYARRYLLFLEAHDGCPILKYEEFTRDPKTVLAEIADHLALPFAENFEALAPLFKLTGDSGRSGDKIASRPRRSISESFAKVARDSAHLKTLCERLDYPVVY